LNTQCYVFLCSFVYTGCIRRADENDNYCVFKWGQPAVVKRLHSYIILYRDQTAALNTVYILQNESQYTYCSYYIFISIHSMRRDLTLEIRNTCYKQYELYMCCNSIPLNLNNVQQNNERKRKYICLIFMIH